MNTGNTVWRNCVNVQQNFSCSDVPEVLFFFFQQFDWFELNKSLFSDYCIYPKYSDTLSPLGYHACPKI